MAHIILGQLTFWCEYGIGQSFFKDFCLPRDSLLFRLWFDNLRANCCQSQLTAGTRPGYSVQFDRIIDIGLPAKDRKQYLLVMTPRKTVLYIGQPLVSLEF